MGRFYFNKSQKCVLYWLGGCECEANKQGSNPYLCTISYFYIKLHKVGRRRMTGTVAKQEGEG